MGQVVKVLAVFVAALVSLAAAACATPNAAPALDDADAVDVAETQDEKANPQPDYAVTKDEATPDVPAIEIADDATCPLAVITATEESEPQSTCSLSGSKSQGAGGNAIKSYHWDCIQQPSGTASYAFHPNADSMDVEFGILTNGPPGPPKVQLNVSGIYKFTLTVTDVAGVKSCQPATLMRLVMPLSGIHLELLWDTPGDLTNLNTGLGAGADLDLHFANEVAYTAKICQVPPEECPNGADCPCLPDNDKDGLVDPWFSPLDDCYWLNVSSNWGDAGSKDDNPRLTLDDTDGWGPENLNMQAAAAQTYSIGVHYWDAFQYGHSIATVNVYLQGVLAASYVQDMNQCDFWWVKKLKWPQAQLIDFPAANLAAPSAGKITPNYGNKQMALLGAKCIF